jgi:hypothetical protein
VTPWSRIVAIIALLGLLAPQISALALGVCAAAVVVGVAVAEQFLQSNMDTPYPEHTRAGLSTGRNTTSAV